MTGSESFWAIVAFPGYLYIYFCYWMCPKVVFLLQFVFVYSLFLKAVLLCIVISCRLTKTGCLTGCVPWISHLFMFFLDGDRSKTDSVNKSLKGLPLETKNTRNHENRRLGLIESLHMQHCSLRGCIRPPSAGLSGIRFSKQPGWAQWSQGI